MSIQTIDQLLETEIKRKKKRPMAVVAAADEAVLTAVIKAQRSEVVRAILYGDVIKICGILTNLGEDPAGYEIVHTHSDEESAQLAVQAIKDKKADFLMKGLIQTATLLKAVVNKTDGINQGGVISLLMLMEIPGYSKLIGVTDVGIIPQPNLEQKIGIIKNATRIFNNLGYEKPKVAGLSFVEQVNPRVEETVDASRLQALSQEGELSDCIVEGPLSFDIAMSKKRAEIKGYQGDVPGEADILLMPSLSAGNIMVKSLGMFVPGIKSVAFAVGSACPIVLTSRATTSDGKYRSIIAAAAACNV